MLLLATVKKIQRECNKNTVMPEEDIIWQVVYSTPDFVNCSMDKTPVYSIGHGTRKIEDFLTVLKSFDIQYLVDVRSRPYSRFNPQYNRNALKHSLENDHITYVFMGDSLGGRPADPDCYDKDGRIDYEKVQAKAFFREGITRLETAYRKDIPLVIMCSESKPAECHRSKLIGRVLAASHIFLQHIDETNRLKTQAEVMKEMNKNIPGPSLFP
jgi:uncharacterized protein (DUF488 family)